ncbi:MAG: JAB domain-containing protein [Verrucomicrobiota bacterium]
MRTSTKTITPKSWRTQLFGNEFRVMRLNDAPMDHRIIDTPAMVNDYIRARLQDSLVYRPDVENFIVVHLSTRKSPIGFEVVSIGTLDTLLVHPREVFKSAIVVNAACIVIAHNHPSGNPSPSEADIKVTRDLIRAGQLLKIEVVDHIILGQPNDANRQGYASLRELGYFYN